MPSLSKNGSDMYVTVHNYKIGEGSRLDLGGEAQAFVETAARIPGFRAYYVIDGSDHRIASVSIFETREGMEECDRRAAEFVTKRLAGFRLSEVEITEGQVLASASQPSR
jgi:heme-degrading monooxygenase HmoA